MGLRPEKQDRLLLAGLGNPGESYAGSRHNIGFQALDQIAARRGWGPWKNRFEASIIQAETCSGDTRTRLVLLKPQTFYNESGRSVRRAADFWKIAPQRIIVLHDDIDLAPGRVRIKQGGGHAGNKGLCSIIDHVGADVRRVRIGVGHPGNRQAVRHYVLSAFPGAEQVWRDAALEALDTALPLLVSGEDARFQCEVMRLAPAPKTPGIDEADGV